MYSVTITITITITMTMTITITLLPRFRKVLGEFMREHPDMFSPEQIIFDTTSSGSGVVSDMYSVS